MMQKLHIGNLICSEVVRQKITNRKFGEMINMKPVSVPTLFKRPAVKTDLLVKVSEALNTDFLEFYYQLEPMKSLQKNSLTKLIADLDKVKEHIIFFNRTYGGNWDIISFAKGLNDIYRIISSHETPGTTTGSKLILKTYQ